MYATKYKQCIDPYTGEDNGDNGSVRVQNIITPTLAAALGRTRTSDRNGVNSLTEAPVLDTNHLTLPLTVAPFGERGWNGVRIPQRR